MKHIMCLALCLASLSAFADNMAGQTVATCGTPNAQGAVGQPGTVTVDKNGNLCTSGGGSTTGGGTGGGTVTQGSQGTPAQSWYVEQTDGTNVLGTAAHPTAVQNTAAVVGGNTVPILTSGTSLASGFATTSAPTYSSGNSANLSLTLSGALRVDGSGVIQPVSGTVTAAQQQGASTFTVNQGSATTTASQVLAAASGLVTRSIRNDPASTVPIVFGNSSVTATTGFKLSPGDAFDLSKFPGAVYVITASGTATVDYIQY